MKKFLHFEYLWVFVVAIILAVVALVVVSPLVFTSGERYLAVYLQTGDIYFGRQIGSYGLTLQEVWLFEHGQDGSTSLVPLSSAPWHPSQPIHINDKQVVFWTYLDPKSQVAQVIAGKLTMSAPTPQQYPGGNNLPVTSTPSAGKPSNQ